MFEILLCKSVKVKKQVLLTYFSESEKSIQRADCKDKISTKKCKKLKKKGKCQDKKTWKKCMETCEKCTPGTVPLIMVLNYSKSILNQPK